MRSLSSRSSSAKWYASTSNPESELSESVAKSAAVAGSHSASVQTTNTESRQTNRTRSRAGDRTQSKVARGPFMASSYPTSVERNLRGQLSPSEARGS